MIAVKKLLEKHGLRLAGVLLALLLAGIGLTSLRSSSAEVKITGAPIVIDEGQYASIDINAADAEELEELPKIGKVLATRIVAYRQANGPFRSLDDLKKVDGINQSVIDAIRDKVVI